MQYLCSTFILALLFVNSAHAMDGSRLGYGVSLRHVTVEDPDGSVPAENEFGFLNLFYVDEYSRDTRYYVEFTMSDTDIDAKGNKIGQDISSTGIRTSFQKRLRLGRFFKPWVGAGAGIFQEEFTQRHTIDSDGFLLNTFPDRDTTHLVLSVDASSDWELTEILDLSVRLLYGLPLDDGTGGISLTAILLYKGFL